MSKVMSFTKDSELPPGQTVDVSTSPAEAPATEIPTRPANEETAVAVRRPSEHTIFNDRAIGFDEIKLSRINIVQKVGDLSNIFNQGEIVLDQQQVIHTPASKNGPGEPPLKVTVLGFKRTIFVEKVEGGVGGLRAKTEDEVVRLGGTLDYEEHHASGKKMPLFQPMETALLLIEKPDEFADPDHTVYPFECEGRRYMMVLWSMKGAAYTDGAKVFFTARKHGILRDIKDASGKVIDGGFPTHSYALTTKLKPFRTGNFAHVPVLTAGPKNSETFRRFVNDLLGIEA